MCLSRPLHERTLNILHFYLCNVFGVWFCYLCVSQTGAPGCVALSLSFFLCLCAVCVCLGDWCSMVMTLSWWIPPGKCDAFDPIYLFMYDDGADKTHRSTDGLLLRPHTQPILIHWNWPVVRSAATTDTQPPRTRVQLPHTTLWPCVAMRLHHNSSW